MDFDKVKHNFGTWADFFQEFIEGDGKSDPMKDLFKSLRNDARRGKIICPEPGDTFRCFMETEFNELRAVLLLQDPYPWVMDGIMVADGLAMSCRNTGTLQPSLDLFYSGIEAEYNAKSCRAPDLGWLAAQGVLLLNTALTVEKGKVGSHQDRWRPFTKYFFENLSYYQRGLPIVLMGAEAQSFEPHIPPFSHYVLKVPHPASAAHRGGEWDSKGMFKWINYILEQNNGKEFEIDWLNIKEN